MAKSIRKISLVLLSLLMVLCLGFAFVQTNKASAAEENATVEQLGSVAVAENTVRMEMIDGAYIRSEDPTGIRFVTYVSLEDYNALVAAVGAVELGTELTANGKTNDIVATKLTKVNEDTMIRFATVIAEIPQEMYGVEITAKSYVKVGEQKYYTNNSVVKSIKDAAESALTAPEALDNQTRSLFEGFAGVEDRTSQEAILIDASLAKTVNEQLAEALNTTVNYVFDANNNEATDSVAYTNETIANDAGEKTLTVYTADGIVKVKALVATDIFYNKADILAFAPIYKDNKAGQYYMLGANIDLEGTNITTYTGSTWTTGYTWNATFDGQGYAISNASCTHGFFASVANGGVIKNMSLINISKASNGGGLFSNGFAGKMENVFVHGTITTGTVANQGGLAATVQPTSIANNVIGLIEYTGAGLNGGFANLSSKAGSTMSNVAIVSTKATVLNSAPSMTVTNSKLYSSVSALAADFDTTSFGAGWELLNGVPVLTNSKSALAAYFNSVSINGSDEIKTGSVITASSIYATLSIKEDIDVTIGANGVVTIGAGVADGTTFTVVANLFGTTVERTFTAKTIVDKTSVKYFIEKANAANSIDLTALGITGADVKSISTTTGEALAFEGTGSTITVNGSSAKINLNALVDIALNSGETYRVSATIVTDVLYSKEDVLALAVNYSANTSSDYYMLGANIDMEGINIATYTNSTWSNSYQWKATFDGQGYALSNINSTHGLFANFTTGTVKNLTVINTQKASNGGGLISNTNNGTIENVFIHGTITSGSPTAQAGLVANAYSACNVSNAVVLLDWTGAGSNVVFTAGAATAKATNVVSISPKSTGTYGVGVATNVQNFVSLGQYASSNYDVSSFTGLWSMYNGLPVLTKSIPALEAYFATIDVAINGAEEIASGDAVTVTAPYAVLSVKDNAYVTISNTGVITFKPGIENGSTFTVVANVFGKTVEKTFSAKVIVDKTAYSYNILTTNDEATFDLATLDASITDAESEVASIVTTTGIELNVYLFDGSTIYVDGADSGLTKGTDYLVDITMTNGTIYRIKAYVADQFINSEAEFKTFYAARNLGYIATTGKVVALNVDIDFNGFDLSSLETDPVTNKRAQCWTEIFDGRGHVLSNATVYRSLFGALNIGGRIRNLGLVNFVDTYNPASGEPTGFIAWRALNSNAIVENCYVYATNVGLLQSGIVGFNGGSAVSGHSTQVNNCVAIIENAAGTAGEGIIYSVPGQSYASCGSTKNIFGVSTTRTQIAQLTYGTHSNNAVYTSVQALNEAGLAGSTLDGVGPWSVVNGSLYFGNMEVGATPTSVAKTYLVENGVSAYNVMVPDNYTQMEMDAALELTKYVKLSTGADLNICTESHIGANPYISVGRTRLGVQHLAVSSTNAFSIKTDASNNYYLIGTDDFGTLYSVYEFLERTINFDAIASNEIIYNTASTLSHVNLNINETPSFAGRIVANKQGYTYGMDGSEDAYLFRYIHGHYEMNDPIINNETGNADVSMYYHNVFKYLNPEIYNNLSEYPEKYNPGWFSEANVQDISELQLCYTAHGDATNYAVMQRKVLEVLWANVQKNTKDVMNYQFAMYDNTNWCECSACTAEYQKYGTHSAVAIKFANDLKRGLDAKMLEAGDTREVTIWINAYLKAEVPPVTTSNNGLVPLDDSVKCVDGVGVVYAMAYADFTVDITNANFNQTSLVTGSKTNYYENLKRWAVITDDLYVWMYGTSFKDYFSPYLTFDSTQKTFQELAKYGVDVVFFEGQHYVSTPVATGFTYFKDYLEGKLLWNVNEDVNALTDKFFTNYFGPAATEMRAYYDSLNAYWNDNNKHAHAFYKVSDMWNSTKAKEWATNIANAKTALNTALSNGSISQDRYNVLMNRVDIENIAVMYINIVSGANTTTAYKNTFKTVVTNYGYTEVGQGYTVEQLWNNWGIA